MGDWNFRVAVSAGHYPKKQGAERFGVTEYALTKVWQDKVIAIVEKAVDPLDFQVVRVEHTTLTQKVRQINQAECQLAIEIHFNAAGQDSISGSETLYFPGSEKGLAVGKRFQIPLAEAMKNRSRGVKPGWYRMDRPGVVDFYGDEDGDEMPDYFLKATNCTALILEPEFMGQLERIREREEAGCMAIAQSILSLGRESLKLQERKWHEANGPDGARPTTLVPDGEPPPIETPKERRKRT